MSRESLRRNTIVGLFASVVLAAIKLLAGLFGHSSALIADAVESFADTLGSILVWQALRVASKPPDDDHPYGYGKAEAVAALTVGGLLVVASVIIVTKAIQQIMVPHEAPAAWTLIVLVVVVAVNRQFPIVNRHRHVPVARSHRGGPRSPLHSDGAHR